jgi:hypothetical protein
MMNPRNDLIPIIIGITIITATMTTTAIDKTEIRIIIITITTTTIIANDPDPDPDHVLHRVLAPDSSPVPAPDLEAMNVEGK